MSACTGRCPCGVVCNLPAGHEDAAFERADLAIRYHQCQRPSKNALASRARRRAAR